MTSCSWALRHKKWSKTTLRLKKIALLTKVKHKTGLGHFELMHNYGRIPTCSLTEARMEEVVSVSDLSPLEDGITGATMAPFSCSAGCSGTGIADITRHKERGKKNMIVKLC